MYQSQKIQKIASQTIKEMKKHDQFVNKWVHKILVDIEPINQRGRKTHSTFPNKLPQISE
jgi:hypothetical protein